MKDECNREKEERKQQYFAMISGRNDGSKSPYLDSEVASIIKVKSNIPKN